MNGEQTFFIAGILSAGLLLPLRYGITYCFLKNFLGFKHQPWLFILALIPLIAFDFSSMLFHSFSLIFQITVDYILCLLIICFLCKGSFWIKLYANTVQASIVLLIAITFIGFDYKASCFLVNNLNVTYKPHLFLLFSADLARDFINVFLLYEFLKIICKLLDFRERTLNLYQSIYLLVPSLASYSMAVLFYIVQEIKIDNKDYFLLSLFPNIYYAVPLISSSLLVSLLLTAYTFKKMIQGEEIQQNHILMEQQFKQQLNHSKSTEGIYTEFRSVMHDIKNHLACLHGLAEENNIQQIKQYLSNLDNTITKLDFKIKTGNPVSDAVINEKFNLAKEQGIEFKHDFILPDKILLEPMDLCIILSNALDNSIEACMRIQDSSIPKVISIESHLKDLYLIITISNSTVNKLQYKNKKIVSKKGDGKNHGIGLSNIMTVVNKYNGVVDIVEQDSQFTLNLMIKI